MTNYMKTTVLLLCLLCVAKLIQAEDVKNTDKVKHGNDSKEVEHKTNTYENTTSESLNKLTNGTKNDEKSTKQLEKKEEEKKESVSKNETKTAEEKKGKTTKTIRRKRSYLSGIKKRYSTRSAADSSEIGEDEVSGSGSGSGESNSSEGDNESQRRKSDIVSFVKTYLDNSCSFIELYSNVQNNVKSFLTLIGNGTIDPEPVMTFMSNFKTVWQEYCDSPKKTKDMYDFILNIVSKLSSSKKLESVSKITYRTAESKDLLAANDKPVKRSFWSVIFKVLKEIAKFVLNIFTVNSRDDSKRGAPIYNSLNDLLGNPRPIGPLYSQAQDSSSNKRFDKDMLTALYDTFGSTRSLSENVEAILSYLKTFEAGEDDHGTQPETESNLPTSRSSYRKSEDGKHSIEEILKRYCELSVGSSNIVDTLKALVKEFGANEKPSSKRSIGYLKFLKSLKGIIDISSDATKRNGYDANFVKEVLGKYCANLKRSGAALTSLTKVLVPQEGADTKRASLVSARALLDEYIDGSEGSVAILDYIQSFLANSCEVSDLGTKRLDSRNKSVNSPRTHTRKSVRPKVRTESDKIHFILGEQRNKQNEYDDTIGWRQGVFEPDKNQNVHRTKTEKSSPRIIQKSKIRRLKKPKSIKNRIINLYNEKENGAVTRGYRGQHSKKKIKGSKENPSTSFQVKTGVERDMGSKDSNPRLRCNVKTKASVSDAEGRTGSSKGHTFSEVPSNDTKTLLCSSETSEVHRPNQNVYIKESVSGKSVVSYDNPDKYVRQNYSPTKENLEIGTSGFSTLNDTSSKNQSVSVVSTDSQNADSLSRSETKFVQGKDSQRGMESSANVEGSIDVISNKNPFITNSRQHSWGTIVENPDRNMESPLPVEKNENLQTYSKFQRTEDFDINFRMLNPKTTQFRGSSIAPFMKSIRDDDE